MAGEEDRVLGSSSVERRTSLEILADAATAAGYKFAAAADTLRVRRNSRCFDLRWPPAPPVPKSRIPGLLSGSRVLAAVPTRLLRDCSAPPWLPCCIKPDEGSLGRGFHRVDDGSDWDAAVRGAWAGGELVVQPLLSGEEYRLTVCRDGSFAAAVLEERQGKLSRWSDRTDAIDRSWVSESLDVLHRSEAPGVGADVIVVEGRPHVLDWNLAPSLALHLVTEPPRDVGPAFLQSWLALLEAAGERL